MPDVLTAEDLMAGINVVHDVELPRTLIEPRSEESASVGIVRLRPLTMRSLILVSRAARDDPELGPLLLVKEALVDPELTVDQLRGLPIGLMHFLVASANSVSGLSPDGDVLDGSSLMSPLARIHLLLAREFGWSAEQVAELTPGQIAIYLAGIEQLHQTQDSADDHIRQAAWR